jgi:hypothetical protein
MAQYFRLHGLTGMLLAVVILLSLVAFLGTKAVAVQQAEATNFYKIEDPFGLKKFDRANEEHLVIVGDKE